MKSVSEERNDVMKSESVDGTKYPLKSDVTYELAEDNVWRTLKRVRA